MHVNVMTSESLNWDSVTPGRLSMMRIKEKASGELGLHSCFVTLQGPELLAPTHDIEIERRRQVLAARASPKSVIASRLELKTSTSVN